MKKLNLFYKLSILILSTLVFWSTKATSNNLEMLLGLEESNTKVFTSQQITTNRRIDISRVIPSSGLSKLMLVLITLSSLVGVTEAGPGACGFCCAAICSWAMSLGPFAYMICMAEAAGTACLVPCAAPTP